MEKASTGTLSPPFPEAHNGWNRVIFEQPAIEAPGWVGQEYAAQVSGYEKNEHWNLATWDLKTYCNCLEIFGGWTGHPTH